VKIQPKIIHRRQELQYSCGAASIAMLFGIKEELARKEVETRVSGTSADNVSDFLSRSNIKHHWVVINEDYYKFIETLTQTSRKFPIYACAEYRDKYFSKGRDRKRSHAVLIADGLIYDPSENREMCGESYEKVFNKSLVFNTLIIIEEERPNFLKNSLKCDSEAVLC
jgi:hypothetical protein